MVVDGRKISFDGDEIIAIQTAGGEVWLNIKGVCLNIGLTDDQIIREFERIQTSIPFRDRYVNYLSGYKELEVFQNGEGRRIDNGLIFLLEGRLWSWLGGIVLTESQKQNPNITRKLSTYKAEVQKALLNETFTLPRSKSRHAN